MHKKNSRGDGFLLCWPLCIILFPDKKGVSYCDLVSAEAHPEIRMHVLVTYWGSLLRTNSEAGRRRAESGEDVRQQEWPRPTGGSFIHDDAQGAWGVNDASELYI